VNDEHTMAKPLRPRPAGPRHGRGPSGPASLSNGIEDEIRRAARPQDQAQALGRLSRAIDLLERGDSGAAAAEASKAKGLAPRSAAVREVLGLALYGQERWQDALTEMKAYRRLSRRQDQNHIIGDCLRALGRPNEVVPLAEETLRAKGVPNEAKAEAVIVAASALADQGRIAEGLAFLARAHTRDDVAEPYTLRLWYVRGDILAKAGRHDEAAREFRKIMRHDPTAFDAAERLAALG
jgi:tetratricopeptide (TPR) repeat protein